MAIREIVTGIKSILKFSKNFDGGQVIQANTDPTFVQKVGKLFIDNPIKNHLDHKAKIEHLEKTVKGLQAEVREQNWEISRLAKKEDIQERISKIPEEYMDEIKEILKDVRDGFLDPF